LQLQRATNDGSFKLHSTLTTNYGSFKLHSTLTTWQLQAAFKGRHTTP
jgi:hypothetical protein